jgi:hypothetical protein
MKRLAIALAASLAASGATAAPAASPDLRISNSVVLTRPDGSAIAVKQTFRVWCGPWESDVRKPSIHVQAGSRSGLWQLTAVVADVRRHPVVRFPHSFVFDKPTGGQLFAAHDRNEASSAEEESSGRITLSKVQCGKRLDIRFKVDAVLGSEFSDGTPVTMRGSFSARG